MYLAAIIYKVLNRATTYYSKQYFKLLSEEDCYDVIIQSILYVLDKKVWENPSSSLYGNKQAPEIAINMKIKSSFMNECCAKNRQKRKVNIESLSLDSLEEESPDGYFLPYYDKDVITNLYIKNLVKKYFGNKDYLNAFILDGIVNNNSFTKVEGNQKFCVGKLHSSIDKIDKAYCKSFSENYEISCNDVEDSLQYIKNISVSSFNKTLRRLFKVLRKDEDLYLLLKNAC